MTIVEIPLDGDTEELETIPNNSENVLENIEETEEILDKAEEIVDEPEENAEPPEEIPETVEDVPAPKRPRGRPKGSTKAKEAAPPKPQKQPKQPKQPKPKKAPKKVVQYESSEEEELPDYVRQQVRVPQSPSQADLATSMLRLLQNHENVRVQRKRNLYDSWFQHY